MKTAENVRKSARRADETVVIPAMPDRHHEPAAASAVAALLCVRRLPNETNGRANQSAAVLETRVNASSTNTMSAITRPY